MKVRVQLVCGARVAHASESCVTSVQPTGRVALMAVAVVNFEKLMTVNVTGVPLRACSSIDAGLTDNAAATAGGGGGGDTEVATGTTSVVLSQAVNRSIPAAATAAAPEKSGCNSDPQPKRTCGTVLMRDVRRIGSDRVTATQSTLCGALLRLAQCVLASR